jgi:nitroreductase
VGVPLALAGLLTLNLIFDLITVRGGWRPADLQVRPRDGLDAFDLMRSRRSCRSFQPGNLTDEHRREIMAAVARYTRQDFLIGEAPVRFEYIAAPLTVWPTVGAHEFLVAIAPKTYARDAVIDVGRSLQHVVLDATRHGIATCWIGPGADHASILKALGDRFDTERDHIICVCAVGYESRYRPLFIRLMQVGQHRRRPLPDLFYADAVGEQPLDVASRPYSEFGRTYEACQWSPSSFNGQTTRAVGRAGATDAGRVAFDFYAATASKYYAAVALGIWLADWETGCEALSIPGRFTKLTAAQRGATSESELPHYDVSWVSDVGWASEAR